MKSLNMWRAISIFGDINGHFELCHLDSLAQDCSNSSVLAMELLQYGTKPAIWSKEVIRNHDSIWNLEENRANFVVRTASADGLTPVSAMASAGTVITKILQRV